MATTSLKSVKATALSPVITTAGVSSGIKITGLTYPSSATAANPAGGPPVAQNDPPQDRAHKPPLRQKSVGGP